MSLTGLAFLFAYMAGIGAAFVRGPIWGLWTYMAVFYLHPPSRWWGVGLPPMRWALFAALVTLVALAVDRSRNQKQSSADDRKPFFSHGFAVFYAILVFWMWVQIPWVLSPNHMAGVVLFTKYLLMVYLFYSIVRTPKEIRDTLIVHIYGCMYLGWLAFNAKSGGRLEGVGGPGINDSNSMAMQFGTALLAGAGLMLREKWSQVAIIALPMPLILNGLLQGNSRGAYLAVFCSGVIFWWMKPGSVRGRFATFAAVGACGFLVLAPSTFWDRIDTLRAVTNEEQQMDRSAESRFVIIAAQFRMLKDYPLGTGHKGTAELSPSYIEERYLTFSRANPEAGKARSSHNTYMSVIVDHGVVGILLLLLILAWIYFTIRRARRRFRHTPRNALLLVAVTGSLAVVGFAGVFAPYMKAEVQFWMIALLMSIVVLPKNDAPASGKADADNPRDPVSPSRSQYRTAGN